MPDKNLEKYFKFEADCWESIGGECSMNPSEAFEQGVRTAYDIIKGIFSAKEKNNAS